MLLSFPLLLDRTDAAEAAALVQRQVNVIARAPTLLYLEGRYRGRQFSRRLRIGKSGG
jgi:hypothetical protein